LKRLIAWLVLSAAAASCAIPEPPPGGPEDRTPPKTVATVPADRAANVSPTSAIEIEFSEPITGSRFERFVEFSPPVKIAKTRWKKNRVRIELAEPLRPDTTYVVRILSGYTDSHNVRNDQPYEFGFATSASVDTGLISGRVYFRRKPTEKGVVRLFVLPRDSAFAPDSARPDRETTTSKDGAYAIGYLPENGTRFLLWAFQDDNSNGVFDADRESGTAFADTVALNEHVPRIENADFWIVDPKEPAVVTGRILNETGVDSIPVTVTLAEVRDTIPPTYVTRADASGGYKFTNVIKGTYILNAFIDFKKDSLCGKFPCPGDSTAACDEYCAQYPDSVVVAPGEEKHLKNLRLEAAARKEE
jgi:hypothetical protein